MDAICLSGEVCVYCADHDSTMSGRFVAKRDEVLPVDGQNGTIPRSGIGKDRLIRDPLIGVSSLQGGHYFVPEFPKLYHGQYREVLVRIEAGHQFRRFRSRGSRPLFPRDANAHKPRR